MINPIECAKITLQLPREKVLGAFDVFKDLGIKYYYTQQSRIAALQEKEAFLILPARIDLFEYSAEVIKFFIPKALQKPMIAEITRRLSLNVKGNGSVYGESVEVFFDQSVDLINATSVRQPRVDYDDIVIEDGLWAISCIVSRGEADRIVRTTLGMGVGIPSVTFGTNQDFKDQFGLLRIVVSAEKEIVNLVVNKSSVSEVMDRLITMGELDIPGKGFIYDYPLGPGVINSKMLYGKQRHLASMEQVISALDAMQGTTAWRTPESSSKVSKRTMLQDLCAINIYSDENCELDLKDAALASTLSGKTTGMVKLRSNAKENDTISTLSEEITTIVTDFDKLEGVIDQLDADGIFAKRGLVELKSVEEAFTYIG